MQWFFYRYAGPDTQVARSEWQGGSWASYLASNQGWIVAQIDGRGSGGDGDRRKFEVWQQLGSTEVQDQIEVYYQGIQVLSFTPILHIMPLHLRFMLQVSKYLISNLHIIDPRRVAVWGWSYGGYVTLAALSDPKQDIFQCGISVAPVTNWRFYGEYVVPKSYHLELKNSQTLGLMIELKLYL